jgi:Zn-dependent M16 (insulinase) family peptidase
LTESQLGESVTGGGLSDELLQSTFSVGLKGVKAENVKNVEELVLATLKKLSIDGFEDDDIKAAVNTLEFRLSIRYSLFNIYSHVLKLIFLIVFRRIQYRFISSWVVSYAWFAFEFIN